MGGKSWWIERGVKHRRKTTGGWVSDRRVSTEERSGLEGMAKNTGVGPRVGWFLTDTRQLKSVVDWREWQITRGRTTGGWVCVRHVSTEECNRLKGVLNTGMACQLKSVAGWKGCQTQAYNHGWLGLWQACVNRRAQWIGRDVKKHRCRSTRSWFSDSQVSSEKRSGSEGM